MKQEVSKANQLILPDIDVGRNFSVRIANSAVSITLIILVLSIIAAVIVSMNVKIKTMVEARGFISYSSNDYQWEALLFMDENHAKVKKGDLVRFSLDELSGGNKSFNGTIVSATKEENLKTDNYIFNSYYRIKVLPDQINMVKEIPGEVIKRYKIRGEIIIDSARIYDIAYNYLEKHIFPGK